MIGITVSKEIAKKLIDEAPGDMVTIITINATTMVHDLTERKPKSHGKVLIDLAETVTFDENEIYKMISLDEKMKDTDEIFHNILFAKQKLE